MTAAEIANAGEARARVDRIKTGVEVIWQLVVESYQARDWDALGYRSWDDMCTREFGTSHLRLPREERTETVQSLRASGMSNRAIASATGYSEPTVRRTLSSAPASNDAPAEPQARLVDLRVDSDTGEIYDVSETEDDAPLTQAECEALDNAPPAPVIGIDGKTYSRPAAKTSQPRRKPLVDEFRGAVLDLDTKVNRVVKLASDDRFNDNADQVSRSYRSDLIRARDALQRVIDQLTN